MTYIPTLSFVRLFRKKRKSLKYVHLPAKEAETIQWDRLSVDLIGPYKFRREDCDYLLKLKLLTMVYPATGWFKIVRYNYKHTATIYNLVDQKWLCRSPRPKITTYNHGNELLGHAFEKNIINNLYVIKTKFATTDNHQAKPIL